MRARILSFLVTAALLVVGLALPAPAQAASGTPQVEADHNRFVWSPEPTIARLGPGLRLTLTMATYVHDRGGNPAVGEDIAFSLVNKLPSLYELHSSLPVCEAEVDASGLATCKGRGLVGSVLSLVTGGAYATAKVGPFYDQYSYTKIPVILRG